MHSRATRSGPRVALQIWLRNKVSLEQAEQCSLIVHYKGKCGVKSGSYSELKPMCTKLLQAGLSAEIE